MTCCDNPDHVVELRNADGVVDTLQIPTGESIVDVAESAGIDLPYGGLYGACGTCTARLLEGRCSHLEPPRALKDDVLEDGYVLACVATPETDCTLRVDHDVQAEAIGTPGGDGGILNNPNCYFLVAGQAPTQRSPPGHADRNLVSGCEDRVLIVAARKSWPGYNIHGLYFCQPNRSFKPSNYLAFYTDGEIKPAVPAITSTIESIELTEDALGEATQIPGHQSCDGAHLPGRPQMWGSNLSADRQGSRHLPAGSGVDLQALRPIVHDHYDIEASGASLGALDVDEH